jgi:threonine/homoserine/homoserine lactone efflux protein
MLTTSRGRVNGPAFLVGWVLGLVIVGAIILAIADPAGASESGTTSSDDYWVNIGLGLLLLLISAYQFRSRPRRGEEPKLPRWMTAVEKARPPAALGIGAAMSGANPKNLLLAIGAATVIAESGIAVSQQVLAYAVFAVLATVGVGAPVAFYFALGDRSEERLARLKDWMGRNNAVIVAVICLLMGLNLIGEGIAGFAG